MTTVRTLLTSPRWLAGLAVAVAFALVCVWLAQWQLDRRVARADRNATVLENYDSEPVAVGPLLADGRISAEEEWTPVRLAGSYVPEQTVLVRNRPREGVNGYLVVVPLALEPPAQPGAVWVVRGWVPAGSSAEGPDAVPAPPPGTVEVVARLRAAEPASTRTSPQGQAQRLDEALLGSAGVTVDGAFGVVATETPAAADGLAPVPRPDTDPGPHLAYGVQWYLFAVAGLVIWWVLLRRHAAAGPDEGPHVADRVWTYTPGARPGG